MRSLKFNLILIGTFYTFIGLSFAYRVPRPTARDILPQGFRISIPDEKGINFFAFHGSVNKEIHGNEAGEYYDSLLHKNGNEWAYQTDKVQLQPGDILYVWIYVQHDQFGYYLSNQRFVYPDDFEAGFISIRPPVQQSATNSQRTTTSRPTCSPSITTVNGVPQKCRGTLIFSEEFDGDVFDQWSQDITFPSAIGDVEFVLYHNNPNLWKVNGSRLHIMPKSFSQLTRLNDEQMQTEQFHIDGNICTANFNIQESCSRVAGRQAILPPVASAKFRSKKSFNFRYGQVVIRAKLPKGDWLLPHLHLEPTTNAYSQTNPSVNGVVKIGFARGNSQLKSLEGAEIGGAVVQSGLVFFPASIRRNQFMDAKAESIHFGNTFHDYSVTWTDQGFEFAVDGQVYGRRIEVYKNYVEDDLRQHWLNGGNDAPFDQEFHIALGVAAGGFGDFPDNCESLVGTQRFKKPWTDLDPKAELDFWLDRSNWSPTWNSRDARMMIESVKVYSV